MDPSLLACLPVDKLGYLSITLDTCLSSWIHVYQPECPPVRLYICLSSWMLSLAWNPSISLDSYLSSISLVACISARVSVYQPESLPSSLARSTSLGCGLQRPEYAGHQRKNNPIFRLAIRASFILHISGYAVKVPIIVTVLYEIVYIFFIQDFTFFYLCRPPRPHYCPLPGWQPTQAMVESAMVWASNLGLL